MQHKKTRTFRPKPRIATLLEEMVERTGKSYNDTIEDAIEFYANCGPNMARAVEAGATKLVQNQTKELLEGVRTILREELDTKDVKKISQVLNIRNNDAVME